MVEEVEPPSVPSEGVGIIKVDRMERSAAAVPNVGYKMGKRTQ